MHSIQHCCCCFHIVAASAAAAADVRRRARLRLLRIARLRLLRIYVALNTGVTHPLVHYYFRHSKRPTYVAVSSIHTCPRPLHTHTCLPPPPNESSTISATASTCGDIPESQLPGLFMYACMHMYTHYQTHNSSVARLRRHTAAQ